MNPKQDVIRLIPHTYISTYCLHLYHSDCRKQCKHCPAPCICPCHNEPKEAE